MGNNTSGWSNPDFDRLMGRWTMTLDEGERVQQLVQVARILNEQVGTIPLY